MAVNAFEASWLSQEAKEKQIDKVRNYFNLIS